MSTKKKGEGFTPPNYTQTPNTLFELLSVISNAELRVTLALVRETFGWHKQRTDRMSIAELAELAGLSPSSAKTGVKEGAARGTIKRFRVKDEQNRPTYRYGLVINERVNFEEFERPRKEPAQADGDASHVTSSGQNLTGSEFDQVNGSPGQILTSTPENSSGQNLTGSYKVERKSFEVKKVEEHHVGEAGLENGGEYDDDPLIDEEDSTGAEGERGTGVAVSGDVSQAPGVEMGEDDEGGEEVPPAAATEAWDPAEVDAALQKLMNRRWLKPWRARGAAQDSAPMIDEVDGSGVDRHRIAQCISPEYLETVVGQVRAERTHLEERARQGEGVQVFTFQHMLIQELQRLVARVDAIRGFVAQAATSDEGSNAGADVAAPRLTLPQSRPWQVGDEVSYRRERYTITRVTDRKITLDSDSAGGVDIIRATSDMDALKLVQSAPALAEASA